MEGWRAGYLRTILQPSKAASGYDICILPNHCNASFLSVSVCFMARNPLKSKPYISLERIEANMTLKFEVWSDFI